MLKGDNVILGPVKREYIDRYLIWMNDPELTQYIRMFRPLTREMEEEWYNNLKNRDNNFLFAILLHSQGNNEKLIGNCSIDVEWINRLGICGIMIGEKEYQGRGYGTEAMKILVQYGFNTLNLNRIELEVFDFNIRAFKSYEKTGFKKEGIRRQAMFKNGKFHDVFIMGILKKEWQDEI